MFIFVAARRASRLGCRCACSGQAGVVRILAASLLKRNRRMSVKHRQRSPIGCGIVFNLPWQRGGWTERHASDEVIRSAFA